MEHSEVHGDHFNAIGFEDNELLENIPKFFENGILSKNNNYENIIEKYKISYYLYPEINDVQICSLVLSKNENNTLESFYPVLKGIKNSIIIEKKYTWENDFEGEIELLRSNSFNLSFFAPFYKNNFSNLSEGANIDVYLAGLAFFVEDAIMSYNVDKGDIYEMALNDFLKDNPKKTKKDFPFVELHMDDAIILFPTNSYSVYEYRGKILDLDYFTFLDKKIAKMKICLEKKEDEYKMFINLYVSIKNLRNCELKVGKDIQCLFWLTGYKI